VRGEVELGLAFYRAEREGDGAPKAVEPSSDGGLH
jgi:hypothetical protein